MPSNRKTAIWLGTLVFAMVGLAFASVPLYRLFCQVTGFGGTPMLAEAVPGRTADRILTIRFDSNTAPGLPWTFRPEQATVQVRAGEPFLAFYTATNNSDRPMVGTSTFNVTPLKAGQYFSKIACFCFTEQPLGPGETARFPVQFFVDPKIVDDPSLREVGTITLSYTFFEHKGAKLAAAVADDASGLAPVR